MKPLKLTATIKDYIWGGTRLSKEYDMVTFTDRQAEAWVLSCHPDGENIISGGTFDGRTLSSVLNDEGKNYLGSNCKNFQDFPMLIKLIDAKDNLSIQVHPDDEYARTHENQNGKTEMWYILDCDEDAQIIFGTKEQITKEQLENCIKSDKVLDICKSVKVKKGDVFFIEAGTIHAICKGIMLAEVQQNSNVTYRVYDYGRLQNGKPRELHVEKAVDVINLTPSNSTGKPLGESVSCDGYTKTLLSSCEYFTASRLDFSGEGKLFVDDSSFMSLVVLEGNGVLCYGDCVMTLYKGESVFLPAGIGEITILGEISLLESHV